MDACAYAWGAQGPDFFFCHRFLPFWRGRSLQEYGGRLHDETPSNVLGAMREFLKAHPDPVYRSYVWGFVCHYSLDCTAHPYINWLAQELVRQRPWETPSTMHGEVEAALDAIVLRYETGKLPSEVPLKTMFPKNHGVEGKITGRCCSPSTGRTSPRGCSSRPWTTPTLSLALSPTEQA